MTPELLTWIRWVLVDSGLHTRLEWGHIIGLSASGQDRWLSGEQTCRPETLRRLLVALWDDSSDRAREAIARWTEIASRPISEVGLGTGASTGAPTLSHLFVEPLWEHFGRVVRALPPGDQEAVLTSAIRAVNRLVLERSGRLPSSEGPAGHGSSP